MQNITIIQLVPNSGSSQVTQSGYLDLTDETIIPITYSIGDIRDISKKNGSFSKSIKIKGTPNNNRLLNHYFDVNESAGTFDIDVIQPCIVIQNGVSIFPNAVIQLISVEKVQQTNQYDEQTEYTLLIKDTAGDFFTTINNGYLEDLNLGLPNHTFNATAITNTFNYTYVNGYKYINSFNPSLSQGNAYNDTKYNIEEFKPAIYARSYFDAIFFNAGYNYNWSSINDQTIQFNRLLIPFSNDEFKDDNLVSFFNVQANSNVTSFATGIFQKKSQIFYTSQNYYESGSIRPIAVNVETVDTGNNYNPSTSTYSNPDLPSNKNNITYTVTYTWNVSFINNESSATLFYAPFDWNNSHNFNVNGDLVIKPNVFVKDNNNVQYDKQQIINDIVIPKNTSFPLGTTVIRSGVTTLKHVVNGISVPKTFTLNSKLDLGIINGTYGDSIITWRTAGLVTSDQYSLRFNITSAVVSIDANVMGDFGFGTTINFFDTIKQKNPFAPKKIKQSDFVKSIFTMFNLYTEVDINNPRQINIYRRDDYYDAGELKDWTNKICKEQNQEVKFLPELTSKKLQLTYKQDSDFPNKTYFDATGEVYGQQEFIFDNQYVRGIDKKEIIFSPTPMFNSKFGAVLPMMIGTAPAVNIRILYDGGEKPCSAYTINNYSTTAGTVTTEHAITATTYSYANHWDTPTDPTYDLNFGICDYYYRTDTFGSPTNNTLFNSHWRRTLNLINNGKMLTAMFSLNEKDINQLRLNDKIFINNSWWNINRVIDYDANSNQPTKVELISIDDFLQLPFTERQHKFLTKTSPPYVNSIDWLGNLRNPFINWNGGTNFPIIGMNNYVSPAVIGGSLVGSDNGLGGGTQFVVGSNNVISDDAFVYGSNNTISTKSFVVGSSNTVETGNNIVMGSGNIIGSAVTDSFIIGNSITATTSGSTLFTNNINIATGGTISLGDRTIIDASGAISGTSLNLLTPAIVGRETLLTAMVNDNAVDKIMIANGTTVANRFAGGFVGYTEGGYGAIFFRGLGSSTDDLSANTAFVTFLGANTNNSSDPNNGTLSAPTNRPLFSFGTTNTYMIMGASGNLMLQNGGTFTDNLTDRVQVNGSIIATSIKKSGGTNSQFLMADGSVTEYKEYTTIFNTTGTTVAVTVLYNTIGAIVWTNIGTGRFRGTLSGAFPVDKVVLLANTGNGGIGFVNVFRNDNDTIQLNTYDTGGVLANDIIDKGTLTVKVFP